MVGVGMVCRHAGVSLHFALVVVLWAAATRARNHHTACNQAQMPFNMSGCCAELRADLANATRLPTRNPCWRLASAYGDGTYRRERGLPPPPPRALCLPHFFVLGPEKSGSTNVFSRLLAHPHVLAPHTKETGFFSTRVLTGSWHIGLTQYGQDNFRTMRALAEVVKYTRTARERRSSERASERT